jgi:hypothetical protein
MHVTASKLHRRGVLVAGLAAALAAFTFDSSVAAGTTPIKIAVFEFELKDASAAGGVIPRDAIDTENLKQSTEMTRSLLSASGHFTLVDTGSVADEVASAGGIQACDGCDVPLARKLGADQSLVGVVTRVSRAEYTVTIVVKDVANGATISSNFSGLRMGANYSWPRGVKSLVNRMLPKDW